MGQHAIQNRAARGQAGVFAMPERRTGGHGQQVWQVTHQHADDSHRDVAVGYPHVDVQAKHNALVRHPRQPLLNPFVPLGWKNHSRQTAIEGMSRAQCQIVTQRTREVAYFAQRRPELLFHFLDIAADARLHLDHRLHQFGGDVGQAFFLTNLQDPHRAGCQVAGVGVDDLQLQFNAQRVLLRCR